MKNILNRQVFETQNFNNRSVGPFAFMVHKVQGKSDYHVLIRNSKREVYEILLIFDDKSDILNPHVDLSKLHPSKPKSVLRLHSSIEHVLFYNSKDHEKCRIQMRDSKSKKVEFDSYRPNENDIYVIGLLKPGAYELNNISLGRKKKFEFSYMRANSATLQNVDLKNRIVLPSKPEDFKPEKMDASKGLVIEFSDSNRGFDLKRTKDFNIPEKDTFSYNLRKEIAERRKKRKKPNRKLIKKFRKGFDKG